MMLTMSIEEIWKKSPMQGNVEFYHKNYEFGLEEEITDIMEAYFEDFNEKYISFDEGICTELGREIHVYYDNRDVTSAIIEILKKIGKITIFNDYNFSEENYSKYAVVE